MLTDEQIAQMRYVAMGLRVQSRLEEADMGVFIGTLLDELEAMRKLLQVLLGTYASPTPEQAKQIEALLKEFRP